MKARFVLGLGALLCALFIGLPFWSVEDNGVATATNVAVRDDAATVSGFQVSVVGARFIIGDCDGSGGIDISDAVFLVAYIFAGGAAPDPFSVGDVDCSGDVDISDVTYLVAYIFASGPQPCYGMPPTGSLVKQSACKTLAKAASADSIASNQDCMEYQCDGGTILLLKHINAGLNCCARAVADIDITGNTITIVEGETFEMGPCFCLCLFDIDYEIANLPPGLYTIQVVELNLYLGDDPLTFTVDFSGATSGIYCVPRDHYPWGQ